MYEAIDKNKKMTNVIIAGFVLMITIIVYAVCQIFDLGEVSIFIALIVSCISAYASYSNCDKMVLKMSNARPATHEEDQKLVNILETLMLASGLPAKPKLYVIDDSQPNAFATGIKPEKSVICVTTGLLQKMNYYELEGVIAHEMGHIKNYDIRLNAVVTVMLGFVVMLSDMFGRIGLRRSGKSNNNDSSSIVLVVVGVFLLMLAPIFGKLMQLAISRKREYMADATAVEFTRNPDGLISALEKLDSDPDELEVANSSTAHMYIVCPLKNKEGKKVSNLFATHPPIKDRVEALRNLK